MHTKSRVSQGSEFRVRGSEFRAQIPGFRVQNRGFRVQGSGFRVQGFELGVNLPMKSSTEKLERMMPRNSVTKMYCPAQNIRM